ncbi:hypothetical protein H311_03947, partial [Anncaliia algerae PRA109]
MSTSRVLTETLVISNHKNAITGLEVLDFNNTEALCSSSRDGRVLVYNLRNDNEILREFNKHSHFINSIAVAKKAQKVIVVESDKIGRVFDLNSTEEIILQGHSSDVLCVAIDYLETKIVTGSVDKNIYIWNAEGKLEKMIAHTIENGHTDWITCVDFKPFDENEIISGSYDGTIKLWDIEKKELKGTFYDGKLVDDKTVIQKDGSMGVKALNISADGSLCAYGGRNGKVYIIELNGNNELLTSFDVSEDITSLAFGLTEMILASGTKTKIFLWDVTSSEVLDTIDLAVYGGSCECMS